jgi:uridine kinase
MTTSFGAVQRPIILGIVGDSAAGKTTLSHGITQILGAGQVSVLCTDDYHRYNRQQRKELSITPLNPDCNYLDMMAQHLRLLLRWRWKLRRDSTQRGYSEQEVLRELEVRESDSAAYIRPQRYHADIEVSFYPDPSSRQNDDAHLNVRLTLHGTLPHPDLSQIIDEDRSGRVRSTLGREEGRAVEYLEIDGSIPDEPARALERGILAHLDECGAGSPADLGQYFDNQVRYSHPLALTQLLLVYHLLRARQREEVEV